MDDDPIDHAAWINANQCERAALDIATRFPIEAVTPYRDVIEAAHERLAGLLSRLPIHDPRQGRML